MRKGQRFTPALLEKWHSVGRGTGNGSSFLAWHQVTRSDPGSQGRSHLLNWKFERLHHLLSDHEKMVFGFVSMLPNLVDLREQYPLPNASGRSVLVPTFYAMDHCTGTLDIAEDLGIRHPVVRKNGTVTPWVMSTDFLVDLEVPGRKIEYLAVSVKLSDELEDPRKLDLLKIERDFWQRQGICWLLLTPHLYDKSVGVGVIGGMAWAIDTQAVPDPILEACAALVPFLTGNNLRQIVDVLSVHFGLNQFDSQRIFWQTVWSGRLPIKFARSLRPGAIVEFLPDEAFWRQNPVVSRRTAWTT